MHVTNCKKTNLNQDLFNEETSYHILFEFGPPCGYLKLLSSIIKGHKYHDVQMLKNRSSVDLEALLTFKSNMLKLYV